MKIVSLIVLVVIGLLFLTLAYYILVGHFIFKKSFSRKSKYHRAMRKNLEKDIKEHKIDLCWWDKQDVEKVCITSGDSLKLVGHFISKSSNKTAIIVHGFGQNYTEMQQFCKLFLDMDFNVLVVENRAHGASEGDCVGFGLRDSKDLLKWIEFVNQKLPNGKIVLFGLSMGATAVCMASGQNLPKNVVAAISDSAFANGDQQIRSVLKKYSIFGSLIRVHLYSFLKRIHGFDIKEVDAAKAVRSSEIPLLFIHSKTDEFVPVENVYQLSGSAKHCETFIVDEAEHGRVFAVAGSLYRKKISDFLRSRTSL